MDICYQNSLGKKIYLDRYPFRMLSSTNLFDYEWQYEVKQNNRIKKIKKASRTAIVELVVSGRTSEEYLQNITQLYEALDHDCVMESPGRLYCGEYYLQCYFFKGEKPKKYLNVKQTTVTFTIVTDLVDWMKEKPYIVKPYMEGISDTSGGDFDFDFAFDYARELPVKRIINDGVKNADFELIVYGPCENPMLTIGGHIYRVNTVLVTGEYMKINSITKKVYKVKVNGEQVSLYHYRDRDNYIHQKIAPGINDITWDGTFGFDITILEERSEPKWI